MTFFNKKQEVIDLQLTPYGEAIMARGKFKPAYYAFFDDNILYDASGSAGITEAQNDAEPRIQENTPNRKVQYVFEGVETRVSPLIRDAWEDIGELMDTAGSPGEFAMATDETILRHLEGNGVDVEGYFYINRSPSDVKYTVLVGDTATLDIDTGLRDRMISSVFDDGTFLYLTEDTPNIILDITEQNIPSNIDYDVEVFEVQNGVDGAGTILTPLSFQKQPDRIVNNILLDEDEIHSFEQVELNSSYAEYFFQVNTDLEIPEEEICPRIVNLRSLGFVIDDIPYDCPDVQGVPSLDIYETNIKESDVEECD
jgi:hypothetical protein